MSKILLSNRYEIKELIGVGGMAKVYLAKDTLLQRDVAVKVLKDQYVEDEEFVKKFSNEARSVAKLSHVNIVSVYDIGEDLLEGKKINYMVMEYVKGRTLKALIDEEGPLSNEDIIDYSTQIAQALNHAHENGVIHRDIKPQNMLVNEYGLLKVTDFGIARVATNATITYTNSILGTVHYISPEQAKGKIVDAKSDLYSLGVVMYEMATGKVPFDADNSVGIAVMHIQDEPTRPKELNPDLSDHLDKIIMKLLRKDPTERFSSAEDLIEALDDPTREIIEDYDLDNQETAKIPGLDKSYFDREDDTSDLDRTRVINRADDTKTAVYVTPTEDEEEEAPSKKTKKKKKSKIRPLSFVAIILVALVIFFTRPNKKDLVPIPAVIGLSEEDAIKELEDKGLKGEVAGSEESDSPEGTVIDQNPSARTEVKKDTTVKLTISKGREIEVPDFSDLSLAEAEEKLQELGLKLGKTKSEFSDTVAKDVIISQDPSPGKKVEPGSEVSFTISNGKDESVQMIEVQNFTGMNKDDAIATAQQQGLVVGKITEEKSETVDKGIVMGQTISAGTQVAINSTIDFVVSGGHEEKDKGENSGEKSPTVNVEFDLAPPNQSDNFEVTIFDVDSNGNTGALLYDQTHNPQEVDSNGKFRVRFKSQVGNTVSIYYDGNYVGTYQVSQNQ